MKIPQQLLSKMGEYKLHLSKNVNSLTPIGWGYRLISRLTEEEREEAYKYGTLECDYPDWYLIIEKEK